MHKLIQLLCLCPAGALAAFAGASSSRIGATGAATSRSALFRVSMFNENEKSADEKSAFAMRSQITRSRESGLGRKGCVTVTDGSGSFYGSRTIFNQLYDFGGYARLVASSPSVADAKKMLISRQSRYSGLLDVLEFHEGETPAFEGAGSWLAIDANEDAFAAEVDAAKDAGVERIFLLYTAPPSNIAAIESKLEASGLTYTIMRTGALVDGPAGDGLKLDAFEMPTCEDVAKEDVFRFVAEALTLPEASSKVFSLCPSTSTSPALKQMRLAGYERRDEVQALLKGVVPEEDATAPSLTPEEAEVEAEVVMRSEAEVAAEREEELKALLEKARQRGMETQARLKFEEEERLKNRKEQEKYYKAPNSDDDDDKPSTPSE